MAGPSHASDPLVELEFGDLELPPLESFLGTWPPAGVDCGSLATSLELDNDVLPSTPLTEEQMLQQQTNDEQVRSRDERHYKPQYCAMEVASSDEIK